LLLLAEGGICQKFLLGVRDVRAHDANRTHQELGNLQVGQPSICLAHQDVDLESSENGRRSLPYPEMADRKTVGRAVPAIKLARLQHNSRSWCTAHIGYGAEGQIPIFDIARQHGYFTRMLQNYDSFMNTDDDRRRSSFPFVFFGREVHVQCQEFSTLVARSLHCQREDKKGVMNFVQQIAREIHIGDEDRELHTQRTGDLGGRVLSRGGGHGYWLWP
jgi:hypothetical protein